VIERFEGGPAAATSSSPPSGLTSKPPINRTISGAAAAYALDRMDALVNLSSMLPFLKWAGGKRQLLPKLRAAAPSQFSRYIDAPMDRAVCSSLLNHNVRSSATLTRSDTTEHRGVHWEPPQQL
jgi:hypothetical protein